MTTPSDPTENPLRVKTSLEHLPETKQRQLRRMVGEKGLSVAERRNVRQSPVPCWQKEWRRNRWLG